MKLPMPFLRVFQPPPDSMTNDASIRAADDPAYAADLPELPCPLEGANELVQAWLDLLGEIDQSACKPASS